MTEMKNFVRRQENATPALVQVTLGEVSSVGSPMVDEAAHVPRPAGIDMAAFAHAAPGIGEDTLSALAADGVALERIGAVVSACAGAVAKAAQEMGLTPEEQRVALADLVREAERRAPQIVTVLLVISQLPTIEARARRHFLQQRQESRHDAEELSQGLVLKILGALTAAWPRGNVGAWLATVRDNFYRDHRRGRSRQACGMQRLERAFHAMRD